MINRISLIIKQWQFNFKKKITMQYAVICFKLHIDVTYYVPMVICKIVSLQKVQKSFLLLHAILNIKISNLHSHCCCCSHLDTLKKMKTLRYDVLQIPQAVSEVLLTTRPYNDGSSKSSTIFWLIKKPQMPTCAPWVVFMIRALPQLPLVDQVLLFYVLQYSLLFCRMC